MGDDIHNYVDQDFLQAGVLTLDTKKILEKMGLEKHYLAYDQVLDALDFSKIFCHMLYIPDNLKKEEKLSRKKIEIAMTKDVPCEVETEPPAMPNECLPDNWKKYFEGFKAGVQDNVRNILFERGVKSENN